MVALEQEIVQVLGRHVSRITARAVLEHALQLSRANLDAPGRLDRERFGASLATAVGLFAADPDRVNQCVADVVGLLARLDARPAHPAENVLVVEILREADIVVARGTAREEARSLGFSLSDQVKLATVTSELARNIVQYATRGRITIRALGGATPGLEVVAEDEGGGIPNLDEVLSGRYRSKRGMGRGLMGTRELVDDFHVDTQVGRGTRVTVRKFRSRG